MDSAAPSCVETSLLYFQESDSVTNRVAGFVCKYVLSEHLSCVTSLVMVGREHCQESTYVVSDRWSFTVVVFVIAVC